MNLKFELIYDDMETLTIWRVGQWIHSTDKETNSHSWAWQPEGVPAENAIPIVQLDCTAEEAREEFLALTEGL